MATTSLPGYTSAEVARMLGLSARQIRSYVQADFLSPRRGPRREFRFSFQDLVVLRAARDLVDQRVPTRRVRRVLAKLRRQLPRGRSLAALRISFEGGEVVVRAEGEIWNPESGQLLLDFQVADLARQAAPLAGRLISRAGDPESLSAEDWYELGFELEASALEEAKNAYQRGLELDPMHADAHLNLGRLIHEEGAAEEAEAHYRTALGIRPKDSTAAYNLGVALQDRGCLDSGRRFCGCLLQHGRDTRGARQGGCGHPESEDIYPPRGPPARPSGPPQTAALAPSTGRSSTTSSSVDLSLDRVCFPGTGES